MSENKRWVERFSVDLKVRFGQNIFSENGRVQDISMFGFFIETPEISPKGTQLKVQLLTPEKKFVNVLGLVKWSSRGSEGKDGKRRDQGMGIEITRFFEGREVYKNLCQEYWKKGSPERAPANENAFGGLGLNSKC